MRGCPYAGRNTSTYAAFSIRGFVGGNRRGRVGFVENFVESIVCARQRVRS